MNRHLAKGLAMKRIVSLANPPLVVAALLLAGLVLRGERALAAETTGASEPSVADTVSKLTDEGFRLYRERDYRHASEKFLQAYALDEDPNLLFNIARCNEALGNNDGAIEKYEAFMAKPESDPRGKRRAADAVRALRQNKASAPQTRPASGSTRGDASNSDLATTGRRHTGTGVGRDRYTDLSGEGLALYKTHDYNRAVERFLQAYALDPDPNLLFNIARCYAALGDSNAAIEKYEAYLKAPGTEHKGREQAASSIRALRETSRSESPTTVVTAPSDGPSGPRENARGVRGRVVVGWVATGVLAAGAVAVGLLALDSAKGLKTAREAFPGDGPDISSRSSRTTVLTLSTDGLAIAAAVMAGVSLYWTLGNSPSSEVREVHAAVGPGGLRIAGSF